MKRKKITLGTKVLVNLTLNDRDLILEKTFCDSELVRFAVVEGTGLRITLSLNDIEDIQGYIAAEANHTKNKKLEQELVQLSDKLQTYLDKYIELE